MRCVGRGTIDSVCILGTRLAELRLRAADRENPGACRVRPGPASTEDAGMGSWPIRVHMSTPMNLAKSATVSPVLTVVRVATI